MAVTSRFSIPFCVARYGGWHPPHSRFRVFMILVCESSQGAARSPSGGPGWRAWIGPGKPSRCSPPLSLQFEPTIPWMNWYVHSELVPPCAPIMQATAGTIVNRDSLRPPVVATTLGPPRPADRTGKLVFVIFSSTGTTMQLFCFLPGSCRDADVIARWSYLQVAPVYSASCGLHSPDTIRVCYG